MKKIICAAAALALSACTSLTIRPVGLAAGMKHVCIQENPKVIVADFLEVTKEGFERNGVTTEVFRGEKPASCEYVATYTATQKWDMSLYLAHAEIRIERNDREVGYGEFHLTGGGGLALTKYASTQEKMDPVINALLTGDKPIRTGMGASEQSDAEVAAGPVSSTFVSAKAAPALVTCLERNARGAGTTTSTRKASPEITEIVVRNSDSVSSVVHVQANTAGSKADFRFSRNFRGSTDEEVARLTKRCS